MILASSQTCQGEQEHTIAINEITCEVANVAQHVTSARSTIKLGGREALLAYSKAGPDRTVAWLTVNRIINAYLLPCKLMLLSAPYDVTFGRDSGSEG